MATSYDFFLHLLDFALHSLDLLIGVGQVLKGLLPLVIDLEPFLQSIPFVKCCCCSVCQFFHCISCSPVFGLVDLRRFGGDRMVRVEDVVRIARRGIVGLLEDWMYCPPFHR